MTIETLSDDNF